MYVDVSGSNVAKCGVVQQASVLLRATLCLRNKNESDYETHEVIDVGSFMSLV